VSSALSRLADDGDVLGLGSGLAACTGLSSRGREGTEFIVMPKGAFGYPADCKKRLHGQSTVCASRDVCQTLQAGLSTNIKSSITITTYMCIRQTEFYWVVFLSQVEHVKHCVVRCCC